MRFFAHETVYCVPEDVGLCFVIPVFVEVFLPLVGFVSLYEFVDFVVEDRDLWVFRVLLS